VFAEAWIEDMAVGLLLVPFASLAAPSLPPAHCAWVSVGGGWAGIYSAWRVAVDAKTVSPSEVCVFEASERLGGRTFTVRSDDTPSYPLLEGLNIDVGAYRFAFEQHLPADLIRGPLDLPTACYIPSCEREPLDANLTLHKIVDRAHSSSAGYGTALDTMLSALRAAGVHVATRMRLAGVHAAPASANARLLLEWEGGGSTLADAALLNMPRHAINALSDDSLLFTDSTPRARSLLGCSRESSQANYTREASVKIYLVYADAWWHTLLNLTEGEVRDPSSSPTDPPLYLRYHDGPIRCEEASASSGAPADDAPGHAGGEAARKCAGALLVQYAHSLETGAAFYMPYRHGEQTPLTVLPTTASPLPTMLHAKLMRMHGARLRAVGVDPATLALPSASVAGYWTHARAETLHPAPDPLSFSTAHGQLPACLQGLSSSDYSASVRQPVANAPLFVANNDCAPDVDSNRCRTPARPHPRPHHPMPSSRPCSHIRRLR
jgi:hypothetical protein